MGDMEHTAWAMLRRLAENVKKNMDETPEDERDFERMAQYINDSIESIRGCCGG